jgi:hypothetical protein
MERRSTAASVAIAILLVVLTAACSPSSSGNAAGYPSNFRATFMADYQRQLGPLFKQMPFGDSVLSSWCNCYADKILTNYRYEDYLKYTQGAFRRAVGLCAEQ